MSIYQPTLEYYVYAYLREDGSPYYIGKGKSNRLNSKQRTANLPKNKSDIIIIQDKLSEKSALFLEQVYISFYGRKDNNTGILRNLTDGGEGTSGRIVSEETKIKMRKPKKDTKNYRGTYTESHKKNCAEANRKKAKLGIPAPSVSIYAKKLLSDGKHNFQLKNANKKIVICPHCKKSGSKPGMTRWHFDQCKKRVV